MAGLQQYNFFPTDLFYPRPQLSPSSVEPASSVKPSTVPLKNPNLEISQDLRQQENQKKTKPLQQQPSKRALFYNSKKKQARYTINPLSLVVFIDEDGDDSVNN
ncbi:hypothetical protein QN277_013368 [Acacia crassicarpa]|uniref:Uncharacterized protein n=1 Tax=Acacia crassicarpa TaxID=499986 RepID=A0AAE1N3F7_9FABA|nr:hypothetical protein QN277_013368 [Acacia crassicarpa]